LFDGLLTAQRFALARVGAPWHLRGKQPSGAGAMSNDTIPIDRRSALIAGIGAGALAALPSSGLAQPVAGPAPFAPQPLPFDPAAVPGLSARLLTSHHDNNYVGAVKRLGAIRGEFAKLNMATAPGFAINGLKREELIAWNSMILHEIYFSGLGNANRPGTPLANAIERDFGSMARWQAEYGAMGKALGGGSGWLMLAWSAHDGAGRRFADPGPRHVRACLRNGLRRQGGCLRRCGDGGDELDCGGRALRQSVSLARAQPPLRRGARWCRTSATCCPLAAPAA
jgi:Fe-Mn family superoxide dismutase